jgi:outer membrane protein OmpA-like peptidoglycan-associated protein
MNPFNWFGGKDGEETAAAATAPKTGVQSAARDDLAQRTAAQDDDRYPKLATVPERPKEAKTASAEIARKELREGLIADTANAQYTDKELRAETASLGGQGRLRGQPDLARSDERVAAEPPAQPAPTMPVASAPAAPLQAPPTLSEPPKPAAAAPAAPRVAPPAVARPQAPSGTSPRRQAAAASAAPVAPPPATPPAPQRQASLAQPAPEKPSAEQPESVLKTAQVATIYFNDGSARLSANDREVVDKVAEVARRTGGTLRIVGHSSVGPPARDAERKSEVNYKMSLERANAVAEELRRSGVPSNRVQVMAEGARNPIYAETSPTGAAGNRRAEIYLDYRERL